MPPPGRGSRGSATCEICADVHSCGSWRTPVGTWCTSSRSCTTTATPARATSETTLPSSPVTPETPDSSRPPNKLPLPRPLPQRLSASAAPLPRLALAVSETPPRHKNCPPKSLQEENKLLSHSCSPPPPKKILNFCLSSILLGVFLFDRGVCVQGYVFFVSVFEIWHAHKDLVARGAVPGER
ncbi:hypothetical protein COCON_G00178490, partial [Conger conger]